MTPSSAQPAAPFKRKRDLQPPSTPDAYRAHLPWEGKTSEAQFRSVAAREAATVRESGPGGRAGRILEMTSGDLLIARLNVKSGRCDSRHDFPRPTPLAPGRWRIEVRSPPHPDGRVLVGVRWTTKARGTPEHAAMTIDLAGFARMLIGTGSAVSIVGLDGVAIDPNALTTPPASTGDELRAA